MTMEILSEAEYERVCVPPLSPLCGGCAKGTTLAVSSRWVSDTAALLIVGADGGTADEVESVVAISFLLPCCCGLSYVYYLVLLNAQSFTLFEVLVVPYLRPSNGVGDTPPLPYYL